MTIMSIFLALMTVLIILLIYIKWIYRYWKRLGVVYINPCIPFGNLMENVFQRKSLGDLYVDYYKQLKHESTVGFGGIFSIFRPVLVPTDPKLIKNILLRDFEHFYDRGMYSNEKGDPLSAHLFNLTGQRWRNLRKKVTPIFSSGKMKYMFQTLVDCSQGIAPILAEAKGEPIDIKDVVARYTTDVIGSCAFGVECNSLKDPNCEFRVNGRRTFERTIPEVFRRFLIIAFPNLMLKLNVITNHPSLRKFYSRVVKQTIAYRESNGLTRKDFMDILIKMKQRPQKCNNLQNQDKECIRSSKKNTGNKAWNIGNKNKQIELVELGKCGSGLTIKPGIGIEFQDGPANSHEMDNSIVGPGFGSEEGLTMDQIIAQCFVFFLAGFETSSTTLTFCLFELTQNLDIQEMVREEIKEVFVKHGGKLTYEAVMDLKYMSMCIDETLRKYPPLAFLNRVCTKDYLIPGTKVTIKEGTHVHIPIKGLQKDKEYFPDPEKFDPNRFTEEMKKTRPDFTYLPFGEGPRVCIAIRFGIMQIKVGLTALIKNFRFTLSEKTSVPLRMNPRCAISTAVGNIWLTADKISQC